MISLDSSVVKAHIIERVPSKPNPLVSKSLSHSGIKGFPTPQKCHSYPNQNKVISSNAQSNITIGNAIDSSSVPDFIEKDTVIPEDRLLADIDVENNKLIQSMTSDDLKQAIEDIKSQFSEPLLAKFIKKPIKVDSKHKSVSKAAPKPQPVCNSSSTERYDLEGRRVVSDRNKAVDDICRNLLSHSFPVNASLATAQLCYDELLRSEVFISSQPLILGRELFQHEEEPDLPGFSMKEVLEVTTSIPCHIIPLPTLAVQVPVSPAADPLLQNYHRRPQ